MDLSLGSRYQAIAGVSAQAGQPRGPKSGGRRGRFVSGDDEPGARGFGGVRGMCPWRICGKARADLYFSAKLSSHRLKVQVLGCVSEA